jgi:hypothetical protein
MRLINTALVFFFSINCFAQVERGLIIENKIRSVKTTTYMQGDSLNIVVVQHLYCKTGDDSIIFFNEKLSFRFVATTDATGRVSQLERFDSKDRSDETHIYSYNKYDKRNFCMEEEIDATYTLVYVRNVNGKTEKILSKDKENKTETIAVFFFDKNGMVIRGEGTTDGGKMVYFKYNEKKLISEIKTIGTNEDGKEETEIMLIEYEIYEN